MMKIGVLALQGDFEEHAQRLHMLGCETIELRSAADLDVTLDGLVLPGGESTAQTTLLEEFAMLEPIRQLIIDGLPVFATCAGLVLLAQEVECVECDFHAAGRTAGTFATLPVCVRRNAYGRQLASSHKVAPFRMDENITLEEAPHIPMTFIRAPQITEVGEGVIVLAKDREAMVAVRFGNQLGITFHPELDADDTIYQLFLDMIEQHACS